MLAYDQTGQLRKEFYFGDRITVIIQLEVFQDLNDVSISLYLLNGYGERFAMVPQREDYKPINVVKGLHELTITIDETIMPGDYSFGLAISHFISGSDIDYIESFSDFKVVVDFKLFCNSASRNSLYCPNTIPLFISKV